MSTNPSPGVLDGIRVLGPTRPRLRLIPVCAPDLILVSGDHIENLAVPVDGNYSFRKIMESQGENLDRKEGST